MCWAKLWRKIELRDLGKFGFTNGCRKCLLHSQGRRSATAKEHHTEMCRARIYERMKAANEPKYLQAAQEDQEKLAAVRPATLAAAARIPGVTPAALVALLRYVKTRSPATAAAA